MAYTLNQDNHSKKKNNSQRKSKRWRKTLSIVVMICNLLDVSFKKWFFKSLRRYQSQPKGNTYSFPFREPHDRRKTECFYWLKNMQSDFPDVRSDNIKCDDMNVEQQGDLLIFLISLIIFFLWTFFSILSFTFILNVISTYARLEAKLTITERVT